MAASPNLSVVPNLMAPSPLPPGWTEHTAPGGQPYYYNSMTKESTYVRPIPLFAAAPFSPAVVPTRAAIPPDGKKKEKPKLKTPVPGTPWLRVITNSGHVFYTHRERKQSVWTVPDEIRDAVVELERKEREEEEKEARRKQEKEEEHKRAVKEEVQRLKNEVEVDIAAKRKAIESELIQEVTVSKKARVEDMVEDEEGNSTNEGDDDEEEEWQREAAAQLAAEAEAQEERRKEEEDARKHEEEMELKRKEKEKGNLAINMPNRVDLSVEEAKALFKTLLREKDVNPLLPWDTVLPQFVSDARYVLLPSVSARKEAFDEYCRDRVRELRQARLAAQSTTAAEERRDPKAEFDKLLREEVKSTRTSWTEWRRIWKKDRRFYGWGRDDREREKRYREWLKELGEQKRRAAVKAEADFFLLLKEKAQVTESSSWKDVKRGLDKDPRYDAVGSSSLREELFITYKRSLSATVDIPSDDWKPEVLKNDEKDQQRRTKERKERAVREREEQVRRERNRVEAEMAKSRRALTREESESEFMTLLTDAIREPMMTWNSSLEQLKTDPRFTHSSLPLHVRQALFAQHMSALRNKHRSALHALFEAHAPALNTDFSDLPLSSIQASLPAQKLQLEDDPNALRHEFQEWRQERTKRAEREFQEMLNENSFVEFWGRVRKMHEEANGGMRVEIGAEDLPGEEEENAKVDLKTLAKSVDVQEIERVLKNDRRYTSFDHVPDQREKWIREYIEKLAAPKLSVHVPEHGK